jgi:hypothetical protein
MKKILRIFLIVVVLLIAAVIVLPYIFKDRIISLAKEEANKQLHAKVEFADISLSLIRNFPDFSLVVEDLSISGQGSFEMDTLVSFRSFSLSLDLMSVIKGSEITVHSMNLESPKMYAKVLADGTANWDIMRVDTTAVEEPVDTVSGESSFKLGLESFKLSDGMILYEDQSMDMLVGLKDVNYQLSGDLTASTTSLENDFSAGAMTLIYDGIKYVNSAAVSLIADIAADIDNMKFSFKENQLKINNLGLNFDGTLEMPADDITMDISFHSSESEFKEVLSLVPATYMKDFEGLETRGNFNLKGFVKGMYNENQMPGFQIDLDVNEGFIQYPDLPQSIEQINISSTLGSPGGTDERYDILVKTFTFKVAENPFDVKMNVNYLPHDIIIDSKMKGKIDLETIRDVIPVEEMTLKGIVSSDMSFQGNYSDIEKEHYDKFKASGSLGLKQFEYQEEGLPQTVKISESELIFNPEFVKLEKFNAQIGRSDMQMNGQITDYLGYVLKNDILKADFSFTSNLFDLNEFMTEEDTPETVEETDTIPLEAFEIPANIDFVLHSELDKVLYDNITLENMTGIIEIKDQAAILRDLSMQTMGGKLSVNGSYDSKIKERPKVDFTIQSGNIEIQELGTTVNPAKRLAPIISKCFGEVNLDFSVNSYLQKDLTPEYITLNGGGLFESDNIRITGAKIFELISEKTKYKAVQNPELKDIAAQFEIQNGNIEVKPFDVKFGSGKATISGTQSLDKSIDFTILMQIPKKELGETAVNALSGLASAAGIDPGTQENLNFKIGVGGTSTNPKISSFNLVAGSGKTVKEELKDRAKEKVENKKEEVKEEVKEKVDEKKKEAKEEIDKKKKELEKKAKEELKKKMKKLW